MHPNNRHLTTSQAGRNLIKHFEGLKLKAYKLPGEDFYTIGYGHKGPDVAPDMMINPSQAEDFLSQDILRMEGYVKRLVSVPLTQAQFDTLVSFTFNCGPGSLARSTLLHNLNEGQYKTVPLQLKLWARNSLKRVEPGLVRRRNEEAKMWNS